jgi:hypothetical protein
MVEADDIDRVAWLARSTVTAALVFAVSEVPDATVAVTVGVPEVHRVTAYDFVPDDSAALEGKVAAESEDVIAIVCVADDTKFQFASTAFTVALKEVPAVCAVGVPVLPEEVPGAAVSPGSSTCSFDATAALIVKAADVPVSVLPVLVAVTVCDEPARISVSEVDARTPAVNADVVPLPALNSEVDVRSTVPVKLSTVRLPESCAVTMTLKEVPAVCVPTAEPPVVVTAK